MADNKTQKIPYSAKIIMFGFIELIILILLPVLFFTLKDSNTYVTGGMRECSYTIGEGLHEGDIAFDYVSGTGYLNLKINGENICYSNLGPERLLPDHLEMTMHDGDSIMVSDGLSLKIKNTKEK